ncbi:unnamed protein product [Ixodes pacificus]
MCATVKESRKKHRRTSKSDMKPMPKKHGTSPSVHQDYVILLYSMPSFRKPTYVLSIRTFRKSNQHFISCSPQQDALAEASLEKLQKKIAEKEEEKERLKKEKLEKKRKEKIEKMKQGQIEKRISELDKDIKNNLGVSGKDVDAALKALDEVDKLPLTQSLLRKEQEILYTVKKVSFKGGKNKGCK